MSCDEAIVRVTEELKREGFGILAEIDVTATLKKKLDVDFRKWRVEQAGGWSKRHAIDSQSLQLTFYKLKNRGVKPLSRHAELAVNLAGTMATFLIATYETKESS